MIASSQELIQDYTGLCEMLAAAKKVNASGVTDAWEENKSTVAQLLENGKKLSLRRVEQLLPGNVKNGHSDASSEPWFEEASHFFPVKRDDTRLQDAFRQATKGVRRFAREIPEKE
jgi:hypothetical protein